MGKKLIVRAVVEGETLFDRREIEAAGRYAQTLKALIKAGDRGVTALEISSWALRLSHYIDVLRKDNRYRLNIETVLEAHEVDSMGEGRHARYILHDNVRLLDDREAA